MVWKWRIYRLYLSLVCLYLFIGSIKGQTVNTVTGEEIILSYPINVKTEYEAGLLVDFKPGASIKATEDVNIHARIDPFAIYPPTGGVTGGINPEDHGVVGIMPGEGSVGPAGNYTYSVPINIPSCVPNMNPNLSLVYNSGSLSEGYLGRGWALSGLSTISRVPSNKYYDNYVDPVDFNGWDRFSLDGSRLILVSGSYGQPGSVYGFEMENMVRVYPLQEGSIFPSGFRVEFPDGKKAFYGENTNSRVWKPNTFFVVDWLISHVEDIHGNRINYEYDVILGNGEANIAPKKITYTSNPNVDNMHTGFYSVVFNYTMLNEKLHTYLNQIHYVNNRLLNSIVIKGGSQELFKYDINYVNAFEIDSKIIDRIGFLDVLTGEELNPLKFTYSNNLNSQIIPACRTMGGPINPEYSQYRYLPGDFNGDGYTDFIQILSYRDPVAILSYPNEPFIIGAWWMYINDKSGNFVLQTSSTSSIVNHLTNWTIHDGVIQMETGDFNGDGKSDLLIVYEKDLKDYYREMDDFNSNPYIDILLANDLENGFRLSYSGPLPLHNADKGFVSSVSCADFRGEGHDCLLFYSLSNKDIDSHVDCIDFSFSNGEVSQLNQVAWWNFWFQKFSVGLGSFNNDSKIDFYLRPEKEDETAVFFTVGEDGGFVTLQDGGISYWEQQYPGDFNGDGLTDILRFSPQPNYYSSTGLWSVTYGTGIPGNLFTEPKAVSFNTNKRPDYNDNLKKSDQTGIRYYIADLNGDGYSDVFETINDETPNTNAVTCRAYLSTSNIENHITSATLEQQYLGADGQRFLGIIDYNGDSKQDVYSARAGSDQENLRFYSFNSQSKPNDQTEGLLIKVESSSVKTEYLDYSPGKSELVYSSDTNAFTLSNGLLTSNYPGYVISNRSVRLNSAETNIDDFYVKNESYKYFNGIISKIGKGFLGFERVNVCDSVLQLNKFSKSEILTHSSTLSYPFVLLVPESVSTFTWSIPSSNNLIDLVKFSNEFQFLNNKRYLVYKTKTLTQKYDIDADTSFFGSNLSVADYDNFGNVIVSKNLASYKKLSLDSDENEFEHKEISIVTYCSPDLVHSLYGRPSHVAKTNYIRNEGSGVYFSSTEHQVFDYFNFGESGFPLIKKVTKYRDQFNDQLALVEQYEYNTIGLQTRLCLSSPNFNPPSGVPVVDNRVTSISYSIEKPWLQQTKINPKNFSSSYEYDPFGLRLINYVDINGLKTSYESNLLNTVEKTIEPDGMINYSCHRWCSTANSHPDKPQSAISFEWKKQSGSSEVLTFFNSLGQEVRLVTKDVLGKKLYKDKFYDNYGILTSETSFYCPEIVSDLASITTTYQYDLMKRLVTTTSPQGVRSVIYKGLETVFIDQELKETSTIHNVVGKLISCKDNAENLIKYEYDCLGRLSKTWQNCNPTATMVLMEYDTHGNRTKLVDPSAGTVLTQYDPYNNIVTWKDSKLTNPIIYNYDILDRKIKVIEPEGVTSWTYDTGPNGLGLLSEVSSVNSDEKYFYDSFGKVTQVIKLVSGVEYKNSYLYDSYGRKIKDEYSTGLILLTEYNKYGSPCLIYKGGFQPSVIWQSSASDGYGRLTKSKLGNQLTREEVYDENRDLLLSQSLKNLQTSYSIKFEYSWSNIGNLNYRRKIENGTTLTESFIYDNLSRLTSCSLSNSNGSKVTQTIGYDNFGNINNKVLNEGVILENGMYGENGNSPYALTSAEIDINQWPQSPQSVTYNSYNKVTSILEGDNQLNLLYGYDRQRVSQELKKNNVVIRKKCLIGSGIEVIEYPQMGKSERIHYLFDGSGSLFAAYIINESNVGKMYYIFTDHLGSPAVISDAEGNFIQQLSYDAWGNRRDSLTWESLSSNTTLPEPLIDRGFTFHEHLYPFTLINMNGRVFDPLVGRFLSPDNYVQQPTNSQNFNRYSYCINNPLKYTDKTGNWFGIDDLVAAAIGGTINWAMNGCRFDAKGLGYFGAGAAAGDLALYGPAGWAAGGAILGASNAALGGGNGNQIIQGAFVGAFSGLAGGAVGQWAGQGLGGLIINGTNVTSPIIKGMVTGAIGGMAGGYAGGFTGNLLIGGDLKSANQAGLSGMKMGAFIGAGTGAFGGYRYAKQHNLNAWTGKSLAPAPPKTMSIYRAVSTDEYNDVSNNGLRPNPNGSGYQEGKLFYKSYQDAVNNTAAYDAAYGQQSTIIKIDVPIDASQYFNSFHMDGYDVIYINTEDLPAINNVMTITKH